jgi:dipeptidyl aminopeptidase/acylaminoacyl peptidase
VPTSGAEPSRRRWFRTVDWPRRLGVLPGTPPLAVVENVCGEIIDTARSWRLEVVDPDGGCRDLLPQLAGSTSAFAAAPVGDRFACSHWDSPVTAPFPLPVLTASDGPVRHAVPPAVRAHGEPVWSPDGQRIAVTAWEGIRVGIIVVDAERGSWRWLEPAEGCCSAVALAPEDGTAVAVFQPVNDAPAVCRIDGGGKTPLLPLPAPGGPMPSLVRWSAAGASLEGLLLTPPGSGPWPLIVDLHGGPNQGLRVGDRGRLLDWSRAGYAAFAPDHRGSGIAGRESMLTQWTGAPDSHGGSEAGDVLAGVDHLVARGIADPARLFLIGFSAGAWLAAHIITIDGRFLAAVTWEGAYDLRLQHHRLGGLESMVQLLGGRPHETPERWALASPVSRADAVRTPVLVLAAERNGLLQGTVWWTALRDRGVPTELVVYRDESHVNQRGENDADVIRRSLAWFRRHC